MRRDPFSECHPLVNFLFFVSVIGFGVTVTHPMYTAASIVSGGAYYLLLRGRSGWKLIFGMLPLFALISLLNPLVNHYGITPLFTVFGKKYTLEALCYGMSLGAMFLLMLLWYGCYSAVLTSDKFTALFGDLIPSLSLLLVMILRLIPSFTRKAQQITGARQAVGKGAAQGDTLREKLTDGTMILSALTDWALEGSIITADSMRSRGYGSGKRTSFRKYRMRPGDGILLAVICILSAAVLLAGGQNAKFAPRIRIDSITWGFGAYCVLLMLPLIIAVKEALLWHSLQSKI